MTTASDLTRLLEPWGPAEVEAEVSGLRNRVWRVRLRGETCIVRQNARSPATLDWELDLLDALHGHDFTVPLPIPTASGERRVGGLVVFTFLQGREPEGGRDSHLVGAELRRLHELMTGWPQRPGFGTCHDLITADTGGDADMSLLPPDAAALCRDAWSDIPDGEHSGRRSSTATPPRPTSASMATPSAF